MLLHRGFRLREIRSNHEQKKELLDELEKARVRTESLIVSLPEDKLEVPYHPGGVNPPLWEMGHSAFFYEVFVFNLLDGTPSYDPSMDDLWDSFHVDHKDRWSRDLFPGREETLKYFNTIYDRVAERIKGGGELSDQELYLYRFAIYHQNMHIESLIWCRQTVGYPALWITKVIGLLRASRSAVMCRSRPVAGLLACPVSRNSTRPKTLPLMPRSPPVLR